MAEWTITVTGRRVRIDHLGKHFHTSSQFEKPGTSEGLAALFRIAVALYGHPFATDQDPDPAATATRETPGKPAVEHPGRAERLPAWSRGEA